MSLTHMWSCRDTVSRRRTVTLMATLMSQAKILEFSVWLVDVAVQQNGARYSFSSVG